jgi:sulfite reductase alpha subunit-like flavoprotein
MPAPSRRLRILYGSQTGCAEDVARQLADEAARRHFALACDSMEDYDVRLLPTEGLVIFVASTTGEGEIPDSMRSFWNFLLRRDLPAQSLAHLKHACFGLGDSSYPKFCYAAKRLHRRLEQLGSTSMVPLGLGDDQDALGVEHALGPWLHQLWAQLDAYAPMPPEVTMRPLSECPPPRYCVDLVTPASMLDVSDAVSDASLQAGAPPRTPMTPADRRRPHHARVLVNRRITTEGCGREVRHLELDVSGWGMEYVPGDALAVQPANPEAATLALLEALGLTPSAQIRIRRDQLHAPELPWVAREGSDGRSAHLTVLDLFTNHLDVFGVPRRPFFALLSHFATNPAHKERLAEFGAAAGAADLLEYATRPHRTCAEILVEFASARPPLAYYLDLAPPLRERYFSISSSPSLHPTSVHITVAVVRYQTRIQAPRSGVCSTYLAGLRPAGYSPDRTDGDTVGVWLRQGCLRLPSHPSAPLVMVGPGTGVAPFRAFVQTRQTQRAALAHEEENGVGTNGGSVGDACLLFGCRRADHDYLYADEWHAHVRRGELQQLHVAFSREPEQPKVSERGQNASRT